MRKTLLSFASCLAISLPLASFAQEKEESVTSRNTNFSLFSSLSYSPYNFERKEGVISTGSSFEHHFGASISKNYYFKFLPPGAYLSFGLRYNRAKFFSKASTSLDGFTKDSGEEISMLYEFVTLPLHFGQTYKHTPVGTLNVYGGLSAGFSSNGQGATHQSVQKSKDDNDGIGILLGNGSFLDLGPYKGHLSADLGIQFYPFKNFQNLGFGILYSQDLTQTYPLSREGAFVNRTQGTQEKYNYSITRRFSNLFLSVNYSFGKKWYSK